VDFAGAGVVEPADGVGQLRAADDGVSAEQEAFGLDDVRHGDELYAGDQVALGLVLRHEAPRPGGRVLDERAAVGQWAWCAYPNAWPVPESGMPATRSTSTWSALASAAPQRYRVDSTLMPS